MKLIECLSKVIAFPSNIIELPLEMIEPQLEISEFVFETIGTLFWKSLKVCRNPNHVHCSSLHVQWHHWISNTSRLTSIGKALNFTWTSLIFCWKLLNFQWTSLDFFRKSLNFHIKVLNNHWNMWNSQWTCFNIDWKSLNLYWAPMNFYWTSLSFCWTLLNFLLENIEFQLKSVDFPLKIRYTRNTWISMRPQIERDTTTRVKGGVEPSELQQPCPQGRHSLLGENNQQQWVKILKRHGPQAQDVPE